VVGSKLPARLKAWGSGKVVFGCLSIRYIRSMRVHKQHWEGADTLLFVMGLKRCVLKHAHKSARSTPQDFRPVFDCRLVLLLLVNVLVAVRLMVMMSIFI
jgi:hypothetical protein